MTNRVLIALFIALVLLTSCAEFKPCTFSGIESSKVLSMTPNKAEIELQVKIKNPNNFGFNIYPSSFNVQLGNQDVGEAQLKNKVHINANSEITRKFVVEANPSKVLSGGLGSLFSIFQNKGVFVVVKGNLKAGTFFYRKKFPIDIKDKVSIGL